MIHRLWIYWITLRLCLRSMTRKKLNLGDRVYYEGLVWTLSQGVSDPFWILDPLAASPNDMNDGAVFRKQIHRDRFKKLFWVNLIHDFRSTWRFYSGYWHSIWLRQTREQIRATPVRGFYI